MRRAPSLRESVDRPRPRILVVRARGWPGIGRAIPRGGDGQLLVTTTAYSPLDVEVFPATRMQYVCPAVIAACRRE